MTSNKKQTIKKIYLILIVILSFSLISKAGKIEPEQAKKVAINYYSLLKSEYSNTSSFQPIIGEIFIEDIKGTTAFYIFNFQEKGFIIVSGDDSIIPILGFSFKGKYTPDNQPDGFKYLINSYKQQIEYTWSKGIEQTSQIEQLWESCLKNDLKDIIKGWKSMEPLITSTWHQNYPYNALCPPDPLGPGGYTCGWCGSAASTQLMHYYKFPVHGIGSNGYNCPNYGYLFADFENTTYEWDAMPNNVEQLNIPVATLIFHFGVAAEVEFGPYGTLGYLSNIRDAFKDHFNYSDSLILRVQANYSLEEWQNMLMNQLDEKKPVLYYGMGGGGHVWLIDGYLGPNYYHCNWNWSGAYDGYYYIGNFSPGSFSFNENNGAFFNVIPNPDNYPYFCNGIDTISFINGQFDDGSGPIDNYADGHNCYWLLAPDYPSGVDHITILFEKFDTELNNDVLTIFDGPDNTFPVLGSFSGNEISGQLASTNDTILLHFYSDNNGITGEGWLISYEIQEMIHCSGLQTITTAGGYISDGSGSYHYNNNTSCMWKIEPVGASYITLTFTEFETENDYDLVKVYDISNGTLLLGTYSGSGLPPPVTADGEMQIIFTSNGSITSEGWSANYISDGIINIEEQNINYSINISPNPAEDFFQITGYLLEVKKVEISIFDITGNEIFKQSIEPEEGKLTKDIDIRNLEVGQYLLQVRYNRTSIIKKLIKL